jgi:hypothetical protein
MKKTFLLAVLGFELWAECLLGKYSSGRHFSNSTSEEMISNRDTTTKKKK